MGDKNKVEIRINGMDYTLLTEEQPEYVHKIAFYVDQKMKEIHSANPRLSTAMAAVLASVTIGDEYLKSVSAADRMRDQIQQYLEEGTADKLALEETRRECEKNCMICISNMRKRKRSLRTLLIILRSKQKTIMLPLTT